MRLLSSWLPFWVCIQAAFATLHSWSTGLIRHSESTLFNQNPSKMGNIVNWQCCTRCCGALQRPMEWSWIWNTGNTMSSSDMIRHFHQSQWRPGEDSKAGPQHPHWRCCTHSTACTPHPTVYYWMKYWGRYYYMKCWGRRSSSDPLAPGLPLLSL